MCPQCKLNPKTNEHFLQCGGPISWSDDLFGPLEQLFSKHHVHHSFKSDLTKNMIHYLMTTIHYKEHPSPQPSVASQHNLGWFACFCGMISQQHSLQPNSSTTLTAIIRSIFHAVIQQWYNQNHLLHNQKHPHSEVHNKAVNQAQASRRFYQTAVTYSRSHSTL